MVPKFFKKYFGKKERYTIPVFSYMFSVSHFSFISTQCSFGILRMRGGPCGRFGTGGLLTFDLIEPLGM
jgi:hypothetical protein